MSAASGNVVPGQPFRTLLRYSLPYWKDFAIGGSLAILFVFIGLGLPYVLRLAVNQFDAGTMSASYLWAYFAGLLVIALATGAARYWQRMLMIGASRKFEYDLRNDYFQHIQRLSQDFFHRTKTGDIVARATNDLDYVRSFVGPGVMGTVDLIRLPFTLAWMIYLSPKLTVISLMPLPIVSLVVYFFVVYINHQSKTVQEQFSTLSNRAQENLAGARVVKAYSAAGRELRDFQGDCAAYMRENMKLAAMTSLAWPLIGFMIGAIMMLVMWQGGVMVIRGAINRGDLIGFIVCFALLADPLVSFGWVLTLYQRGAVGMNRIAEFLLEEPSIQDTLDTRRDIETLTGAVRFDRVSFGYGSATVLHDISFDVAAGKTVAIVGPTGSGKSSIVSLLTREYDPTSGTVSIDGIGLREIPVRVLRGTFGYVPQDTFLFSDSIHANLAFGRPDATRIRHLARRTRGQLVGRTKAALGDRSRGSPGPEDSHS
ncbi:MAG: ABC transporter ATP-binding protein [Candidatus Hydrogenedentes bacterium]|nr:ABC transporter ATP-binding protein [Candidatus Hydrogenedentota bacterium]